MSAQPVVNKVTIPTNVQQIHVPGNKFHYIRLAAPPSSGGIGKTCTFLSFEISGRPTTWGTNGSQIVLFSNANVDVSI